MGERCITGCGGSSEQFEISKFKIQNSFRVPVLFHMLITPLYAAILGLLFVVLSVRTLRLRRNLKIALGDGEQPILMRAIRVHSNFAEYVPISLLLLFFLELQIGPTLLVHLLCVGLLAGRSVHAYGVRNTSA